MTDKNDAVKRRKKQHSCRLSSHLIRQASHVLGALGSTRPNAFSDFFSAALKLLFIWCRVGCVRCGTHKFWQTKLGIVGSYDPFYVGEVTRSSQVKSAFALVCRCYGNNLEEQKINQQIQIVSHFQTFKCDECSSHFADFNVPCQGIIQPNSFYYWAGWVRIAIQERMVQNQVLYSRAKVDSLIGSANCVHMYPHSGLRRCWC